MFSPAQAWAHNGEVGNYISCTASVSSISGAGGNVLSIGTPTLGINLLEGQIPEVQATINYECKSFLKRTTHTRLCFNIDGGNNSPSQNTPRLLAHPKRPANTLQFQLYKPDGTVWGSNASNSNAKPYTVGLIPSNGNQEGRGEMKSTNSANTDKVPYHLKKGNSSDLWGNRSSGTGSAQRFTGDSSSQTHIISAEVQNTDYTPGEYKDQVTVDIRY